MHKTYTERHTHRLLVLKVISTNIIIIKDCIFDKVEVVAQGEVMSLSMWFYQGTGNQNAQLKNIPRSY